MREATTQEISLLEGHYVGCTVYQGELHDHAATGGTSDGRRSLSHWIERMHDLKMDFAAILDHRQVRHMYLPEWQDGLFIAGTEPGTRISDSAASVKEMHYNMLVPCVQELEGLLQDFPEYAFSGGPEGHFVYPEFSRERFGTLIDNLKSRGGFFVHPHPKQVMASDNPLDYWFRDETGIEVFYMNMESAETKANYPLWVNLLALGKRVWACAGGDLHCETTDQALTTIYAEERSGKSYLSHLRVGDFTCGNVGIRMCIGDAKTGSQTAFNGNDLIVCVSDFHRSIVNPEHKYRLDILNENGVVASRLICCTEKNYAALKTESCRFYRAEVFDVTRGLRIAVGNPIWNV